MPAAYTDVGLLHPRFGRAGSVEESGRLPGWMFDTPLWVRAGSEDRKVPTNQVANDSLLLTDVLALEQSSSASIPAAWAWSPLDWLAVPSRQYVLS